MSANGRAQAAVWNVANLLTCARVVALPVIIVGIAQGSARLAAVTMALAVFTDFVDGRLARRMGTANAFGGVLDSTIDFLFIYSLFTALYAAGRMPAYQYSIIYVGMIATLMAQIVSGGGQIVRTPTSKATGALQFLYLLLLVALELVPDTPVIALGRDLAFAPVGALIVLNLLFMVFGLRRAKAGGDGPA